MKLVEADELKRKFAEKREVWYGGGPLPSMESLMWDGAISIVDKTRSVDAIPVEWLQDMARRTEAQAEPHFAFMYVLHEWQESKPIEVQQAESEMRDWKMEQEGIACTECKRSAKEQTSLGAKIACSTSRRMYNSVTEHAATTCPERLTRYLGLNP